MIRYVIKLDKSDIYDIRDLLDKHTRYIGKQMSADYTPSIKELGIFQDDINTVRTLRCYLDNAEPVDEDK